MDRTPRTEAAGLFEYTIIWSPLTRIGTCLWLVEGTPDSMITLGHRSILVGHSVGPTLSHYVDPTQVCSLGHHIANVLAQRCTNVGHIGHTGITLIRRWANIHSIHCPNVFAYQKSPSPKNLFWHEILCRFVSKGSSSAYATNVDYNVYFQRNTVHW